MTPYPPNTRCVVIVSPDGCPVKVGDILTTRSTGTVQARTGHTAQEIERPPRMAPDITKLWPNIRFYWSIPWMVPISDPDAVKQNDREMAHD